MPFARLPDNTIVSYFHGQEAPPNSVPATVGEYMNWVHQMQQINQAWPAGLTQTNPAPTQHPSDWFHGIQASPPIHNPPEQTHEEWLEQDMKVDKSNKIYNIPIWDAFSSRFGNIQKASGEIGLEIECEGTNLFNSPLQWWTTHVDNSLRPHGDHPPVEYVLRKPIERKEVPKALSYLVSKLKQAGSTIDESSRTSVHVHVNCQQLTMKQVYQYVCLYFIFEEIFSWFAGPQRTGNMFCLEAKQAEYIVSVMEGAVKNENFNELFNQDYRYAACNVASLGKFGSVEFRAMRGTVDQALIQTWIDTLLLIRDKALEYDSPREIVEDFIRLQPRKFFDKIFGSNPELYRLFYGHTDLYKSMWDGLRLMRDVAYSVKWQKRDKSLENEDKNLMKKKKPIKDRQYSPDESYYTLLAGPNWPPGYYWICNLTQEQIAYMGQGGPVLIPAGQKAIIRQNHLVHYRIPMLPEDY